MCLFTLSSVSFAGGLVVSQSFGLFFCLTGSSSNRYTDLPAELSGFRTVTYLTFITREGHIQKSEGYYVVYCK